MVELVAHWRTLVSIQRSRKRLRTNTGGRFRKRAGCAYVAKGMPLAIILGNDQMFVPPFDDYFTHRTGMLWGEYLETDGKKGVKPPAYIFDMKDDIAKFQSTLPERQSLTRSASA